MLVDFSLTRLNASPVEGDSGIVQFDAEVCMIDDHKPWFMGITDGHLSKGFGIIVEPVSQSILNGTTGEVLVHSGGLPWTRTMKILLEVERFGSVHLPRFAIGSGQTLHDASAFLLDPASLYCAVVGRLPGEVDPYFENWNFEVTRNSEKPDPV